MILSTNLAHPAEYVGYERGIEILAQAGFDALDFQLGTLGDPFGPWLDPGWERYASHLLTVARDNGVYFNQAHAPLPMGKTGQVGDDFLKNISYERMTRVFEVCGALHIPHVIVHGLAHPAVAATPQTKLEANIEYFQRLKEIAEPCGVRIALENLMRTFSAPWSMKEIVDRLNDDYFLVCVDVGHSNMVNDGAKDLIRALGRHVQALHIHDNHVDYDEHLMPGLGSVDWDGTLAALADIRYSGDFTLELAAHSTGCLSDQFGFDESFYPCAFRYAQRAGRYLADKLDTMLRQRAGE